MSFTVPPMAKAARYAVELCSVGLCIFTAWAYFFQPDALTAYTLWPGWAWVVVGLLLALVGLGVSTWKLALVAVLLWFVVAVAVVEEWSHLLTAWKCPIARWGQRRQTERGLRIVSLNCAGGNLAAAQEVAVYQPDIVLFQESPLRKMLEPVVAQLTKGQGCGVLGADTSVIVNGTLTEIPSSTPMLRLVRAELRTGRTIVVGSVHLPQAALREDLWSLDCWRIHAQDRYWRRDDVMRIVTLLKAVAPDTPVILGGDFNTPSGDASLHPLRSMLQESYGVAGKGWGATLPNHWPLLRVDHIWLSKHFHPRTVVAQQTQHSDHRMVICDVAFPDVMARTQ